MVNTRLIRYKYSLYEVRFSMLSLSYWSFYFRFSFANKEMSLKKENFLNQYPQYRSTHIIKQYTYIIYCKKYLSLIMIVSI